MEKKIICYIFLMLAFFISEAQNKQLVDFYETRIEIILPDELPRISSVEFRLEPLLLTYDTWKSIFEKNFNKNYNLKKSLIMDDFVWVQFLYKFCLLSYPTNLPERTLMMAVMMELSGFEIELGYTRNDLFIFVEIVEDLFEVPYVSLNNSNYVSLLQLINNELDDNESWYYNTHIYKRIQGKPLIFNFNNSPLLGNIDEIKWYQFVHEGKIIKFKIPINKANIKAWNTFPHVSESRYIHQPVSEKTIIALKEQLLPILKDMTPSGKVRFLVNFVRNGFKYMEDEVYFGKSRPLTAEETLYYPVSDCEDRCALLFQLTENILNYPVIAIGLPNHMTIAINFEHQERYQRQIVYKGKDYVICDPTGPEGSTKIGVLNLVFKARELQIIAESDSFFSHK